jgi:hypothetical protein
MEAFVRPQNRRTFLEKRFDYLALVPASPDRAALLSLLFHPPAGHGCGESLTYYDSVSRISVLRHHRKQLSPDHAAGAFYCGSEGRPARVSVARMSRFRALSGQIRARVSGCQLFNIRALLPETRFEPA